MFGAKKSPQVQYNALERKAVTRRETLRQYELQHYGHGVKLTKGQHSHYAKVNGELKAIEAQMMVLRNKYGM